jgi:hypothetical protein
MEKHFHSHPPATSTLPSKSLKTADFMEFQPIRFAHWGHKLQWKCNMRNSRRKWSNLSATTLQSVEWTTHARSHKAETSKLLHEKWIKNPIRIRFIAARCFIGSRKAMLDALRWKLLQTFRTFTLSDSFLSGVVCAEGRNENVFRGNAVILRSTVQGLLRQRWESWFGIKLSVLLSAVP